MEYASADDIMRKALLEECTRLLLMCTDDQQAFFHRMLPQHELLPLRYTATTGTSTLPMAYDLIVRTVKKNEEGRSNG